MAFTLRGTSSMGHIFSQLFPKKGGIRIIKTNNFRFMLSVMLSVANKNEKNLPRKIPEKWY